MSTFKKIKDRILELHAKGELPVVIARQLGLKTSEINEIIEEAAARRPEPEYGFEYCKQLAREAGLIQ